MSLFLYTIAVFLVIIIPLYIYLFNISINIISIITAGIAVLLTIITYFSTQILTKIIGDGSLEVRELSKHKKKHCLLGGGARGLG